MTLFAFWELAVRSVVFGVGAALMAWACDIPPTWNSLVFMLFCSFWSDYVFDGRKRSARADSSAGAPPKPAAQVMTPAEVAAAARATMRKPPPESDS